MLVNKKDEDIAMYDLIIIGSGPAGLSAAVYGSRAGLNLLVIEEKPMSGGQILNTYEVDNYLGMPGVNGFDMGMQFHAHAQKAGAVFQTAQVLSVEDLGEKKIIHTKAQDYETKTVIFATGAVHAHLGVTGEEELTGKGVSYCATCDGAFYRGKKVAVVGGGDVALEDAIYLARFCEKVYIIHRRDEFRGAKVLQQRLQELSNVEILYSHVVTEICGEEGVDRIKIRDVKSEKESEISLSGVFVAVGVHPHTELVKDLLTLDESGYVVAGEDCTTNRPGIFVAGDIRRKPIRQIVTAVADGANAATAAAAYCQIFPSVDKCEQK